MHYHYIGDGLSSSEANFRAALDIAKEHQDKLWIAGMADIHKYQTERNSARLSLVKSDAASITFQLDCATDAMLYDQLLTLEVTLPASRDAEEKRSSARRQVHPSPRNPLVLVFYALRCTRTQCLFHRLHALKACPGRCAGCC